MKKILFGMMAAAVLATSCAKELQDVATGDATVTFAVGTPEIATRAYSDDTTATVLQYAVYDKNGEELTALTKTDATINGSATVELQLTTGNTYSVIFWAAAPNAPYSVNFAEKTMTVDYDNAACNDEARDAFFKHHTFTVTGAQTETIELRRPFAQLNIGTADYTASENAGYTPTQSSVTVPVYTTLNLASGDVDGQVTKTFALANIKKDETFPVAGNKYLAMNYLLVASDKEVVDVEFTYTDGANAKTRTVGSVPVQRNYRTNIYGNLLTSDVDINVEIKPEYNEPSHEADAIQLIAAVGGTYDATDDVDLASTENPYLNIDQSMVLNMNGHTLTSGDASNYGIIARAGNSEINDAEIISNGGGLGITDGASLTFNSGSIYIDTPSTSARYVFYLDGAGSSVIINGGDFSWDPQDNQKRAYVYAGTGTNVYINGGNFGKASTRSDYKSGILGDGNVVITGGTFGFDPANWVADGYKAVVIDGKWHVIADDITVAASPTDVKNVFENGGSVMLADDIKFEKITSIEPGAEVYLNLNGKTITVEENTTSNTLMYVKEGAKLTIDGNGIIDLGDVSTMAIFAPYGELVINNGTFIRNEVKTVTKNTTGLFMGAKITSSNVTINGGYFDAGYYDENAADIEEILAGTKTFEETADDIAKRNNSKDANLVRVALKDNVSALLNHSGYGSFKVYGGTFVGANPAWGDEGCMLPTTPNYLRPWSYYQGALLDGQTFNENGIVLPAGYTITNGTTENGRNLYSNL